MLLQSEILLWLAVLLATQINIGAAMFLTKRARSRMAERAALNAPVAVENLQDILNAEAGQHLTPAGPSGTLVSGDLEDEDLEAVVGELISGVQQQGRVDVNGF